MAGYGDDQGFDGAFRKRRPRPVTDYGSSMIHWTRQRRPAWKGSAHYEQERPSISYVLDMLPPVARLDNPAESIPTRFLHQSLGKSKKPVTIVRWMPEGRRLLAGVHNGEFMLWNGMSFNFETVTAMGSSSLRTAEWSNKQDWLIAANDEGIVFYLQPTLNMTHQFKAHDSPIRDLAFSPTDTKFVSASDDNTLKIWDFTSSTNESTFKDHGWDVKAVDWHPQKGLVVSGSKDHSVRLWDPRTCRNLTTLHGHKNAISTVSFSRLRPQLLGTAARDGQSRIFDLRMMRDVAILRGHEKGVTSLAWHPIHSCLISTGGEQGDLHTYNLTEPNTPPGISTATISPYNTPDPKSAAPQSIYPAHKVTYAHESSIWSLSWHPLGHILATGSNDHYVRFWSRSQPGDPQNCFKDKYHLGEEGAEAQGTFDRKAKAREAKEQEEQELEDEAEGLEDQTDANRNQYNIPGLPGLPGLAQPSGTAPIPGVTNAMPAGFHIPPPNEMVMRPGSGAPGFGQFPPLPPADPSQLARLLQQPALGRPGSSSGTHSPFPPPLPGNIPPNIDLSHFQIPSNFLPPPPPGVGIGASGPPPLSGIPGLGDSAPGSGIPGLSGGNAGIVSSDPRLNGGAGVRTRAPLPSQSDGFKAEQAQGRYRIPR
ncbi:pre-mRNA cleavage and polyadenylation factor (CPF) complex subunit [Neophaeococcomyces mojaviensis]|uniref:Pre-mRNA cleavage and polyadenylation factor (CPF) complex subunit n=1 Tax=Neophaeococcomyces mojaviensis TaxID=3383035 RepID=A0ACC3A8Z5_9EURO|nr:pre-mRNA cleavage and polyadenylation factor (CPF) complex subunit [Knufia sp. JES_112]